MCKKLIVLTGIFLWTIGVKAQDTLPQFSVINKGNGRIIISWVNPYLDTIRQLSIQRSFDSLKSFKSILTLPDPTVPQNGYVDAQAPSSAMFYRLYILLDNGRYLFSKSKRPAPDTASGNRGNGLAGIERAANKAVDLTSEQLKMIEKSPSRTIYIKVNETFLAQMPESSFSKFRDSIRTRTKDTLTLVPPDTVVIRPFVPAEVFKASKFVFTDRDGNVKILLPDAPTSKYSIKFFEEDNSPLFEMKKIKEPVLTLDKVNFYHSGWFKFELYEDGELKEKSKFFVPKDF